MASLTDTLTYQNSKVLSKEVETWNFAYLTDRKNRKPQNLSIQVYKKKK